LVCESIRKNQAIFYCEVCGFGYGDLRPAESCEEFCDTHGFSSPEITRKAISRPVTQVLSLAAA
jgi:hypothetical protein